MRISIIRLITACLLVSIFACRKPYTPTLVTTNYNYLVVEGVINSGSDSTIIKLSRTVLLNSSTRSPERGAKISVESDQKDIYTLKETAAGKYIITNLNLPANKKYRLHILTSGNKEYISDFVENKITPPIDSIYPKILTTGVQFYVSSHDNNNKTRYYRWDYNETWRYSAPRASFLIYTGSGIGARNPDSLIHDCYKFADPSNNIFIANTNNLGKDVIYQSPLGYVDGSTGKVTDIYSLLVNQYALMPEAYKYWELLKKNTEQLGSITDAQPSSGITNIHSVNNPAEPVIGYVSVSTVATKRIFLDGRKLPFGVNYDTNDTLECKGGVVRINPISTFLPRLNRTFASGDTLLLEVVTDSNKIVGYQYVNAICADCRLRGGTTQRPPYWPAGL